MAELIPSARRKPWAAGLLSFLMPGLGQTYNGQIKKGTLFYILYLFVTLVSFTAVLRIALAPPFNLVLPALLPLSVFLAIMIEAITSARREGESYHLKPYNKWYIYIGVPLLLSFVIQSSIKTFVVQAYSVPSGSLVPTLLPGDDVLVDKFLYGHSVTPERGDFIVFKFPEDESKDFIKRVIALPGETLEIRDKQVWISGKLLSEPYTQHVDPAILPHEVQPRDNLGPLTVPPESYFVMGDNRDQSLDSRFWGFVKFEKVKGKASVIYWSWDRNGQVRWDRIGQPIR